MAVGNQNTVSIVIRAFDQTKSGLTTPIANLQDLEKAVGKLTPAFVAMGTAVAAAFAVLAKKQIDVADETGKMAQKVATSAEYLSTLSYAADLSNVSLEQLKVGLKTLATHAFDAAKGSKESADAFASMGIQFLNSDGTLRTSDQLLEGIADRFAAMPDGIEKTALAVKMFGKSGADMIPLLNAGSGGIREMQEEARALGLEISGDAARQAEVFNDTMTRLQSLVTGMVRSFVVELLPTFANFAEATVTAAKNSGVFQAVAATLVDTFKALFREGKAAAQMFVAFSEAAGTVSGAFSASLSPKKLAAEMALSGGHAGVAMMGAMVRAFSDNKEQVLEAKRQLLADLAKIGTEFATPGIPASVTLPKASGGEGGSVFTNADKEKAAAQKAVDAITAEFERLNASKLELLIMEERDRKLAAIKTISDANQLDTALLEISAIYATKRAELAQAEEDTAREHFEKLRDVQIQTMQQVQDMRNQFALDHLDGLARQEAAEQQRLIAQLQRINELKISEDEARNLRMEAESASIARVEDLRAAAAEQKRRQEMLANYAQLQGIRTMLGDMAQVAAAFGKKGATAYKILASAQALISAYLAANKALAEVPFPFNFAAAAVTLAAGMANVASINSTNVGGVAHDGIMSVPTDGSYVLQGGEMVVARDDSSRLIEYLESQGGAQRTIVVNIGDRELFKLIEDGARDGRLQLA